eukprot:TRINITY_DN108229_c0_g1_i1.p1 TRINITY_DN108229_c0_g1~~TRINITY_DN108229_c0_g1_i1.p1  ORF type:complete len:637 (-),score=171.25 TRINITY_DN108229_c0_g1_i1:23-1933(-)
MATSAVDLQQPTAKSMQEQGKAHFAKGEYREAMRCYAAALGMLPGKDNDDEKEQAAALRANRSLCCLRLGDLEHALTEAEQSKGLRPEWPKAHFRVATALQALGRSGEARLATCEARRLAPSDAAVAALQQELREQLFPGPTAALGEALDVLEDFSHAPDTTLSAAKAVRDLLLGSGGDGDLRESMLRAFVAARGVDTIFRRQNAMGDNWREECSNGTMSLLSELGRAGPQLEQELVKLNQEAEAKEGGCSDGAPGCADIHTAASKAADGRQDRPSALPPPPLASSMETVDEEGGFTGILKERTRRRKPGGAKSSEVQPAKQESLEKADDSLQADLWLLPERAFLLAFAAGQPSALAAAAAVGRCWAAAVSRFGTSELSFVQEAWLRWGEALCPGVRDAMPISGTGQQPGALLAQRLLRHVAAPTLAVASAVPLPCLQNWRFLIEIFREKRRLWSTLLCAQHALPGFFEDPSSGAAGEGASDEVKTTPSHAAWPTCFERLDVILPGEQRRTAVAGVVAGLAASKEAAVDTDDSPHRARIAAMCGERVLALPAALVPGSRFRQDEVPKKRPGAPLLLVVGLGAGHVLPGPKAQWPAGSLEVRTSLGFLGSDSRWLGGSATIALLLDAMAGACSSPSF